MQRSTKLPIIRLYPSRSAEALAAAQHPAAIIAACIPPKALAAVPASSRNPWHNAAFTGRTRQQTGIPPSLQLLSSVAVVAPGSQRASKPGTGQPRASGTRSWIRMSAQESRRAMVTLLVILAWYSCNIGVLLLNKVLLSSAGLKRPVFLTLCHMMACATLGYLLSLGKCTPIKPLRSKKQMWKVCLLSSIFCLTIVLGNLSLKYIPVSFNQAIGATTPFFTAIFALLMQGSRESVLTYFTLLPIAGGVVIASGGEPLFNLLGFMACIIATCCRALKSVVQSMIMTDPADKLDPMSLLFYMSSFSVMLLLPSTLILEPGVFGEVITVLHAKPAFFWTLLVNSCMAYAVNLTNFMVTKYTSALTLQVLGNMKGVIAAGISIAMFKNPVTAKGMLGYFITVCGVVAYSETKRRFKLKQLQETGKTSSHPDISSVIVKSLGGTEKEPLLPVNIHASATGMHGQHRKGSAAMLPGSQAQQQSDKNTV